jgi:hypothetical protein
VRCVALLWVALRRGCAVQHSVSFASSIFLFPPSTPAFLARAARGGRSPAFSPLRPALGGPPPDVRFTYCVALFPVRGLALAGPSCPHSFSSSLDSVPPARSSALSHAGPRAASNAVQPTVPRPRPRPPAHHRRTCSVSCDKVARAARCPFRSFWP